MRSLGQTPVFLLKIADHAHPPRPSLRGAGTVRGRRRARPVESLQRLLDGILTPASGLLVQLRLIAVLQRTRRDVGRQDKAEHLRIALPSNWPRDKSANRNMRPGKRTPGQAQRHPSMVRTPPPHRGGEDSRLEAIAEHRIERAWRRAAVELAQESEQGIALALRQRGHAPMHLGLVEMSTMSH